MKLSDKYEVVSVAPGVTYSWFLNKHYAKRIPTIQYSFGLIEKETSKVCGVVSFGLPPSPTVAPSLVGESNKHLVLELNRLVLQSNGKNEASFFISRAIKQLPACVVISYSDTGMGHSGIIYQALNFTYYGLTDERKGGDSKLERMRGKHQRHNNVKNRVENEAVYSEPRTRKHRYVLIHGDKKFIRNIGATITLNKLPYPKGDKTLYDSGSEINKVILKQLSIF